MAKIQGGLLSQAAHGTIGKLITYQGRHSFYHVHHKAKPTDRKSPEQLSQRNNFQAAITVWHKLTDSEKSLYNLLSPLYNNNLGYNIFIKLNITNAAYWRRFSEQKFGATYKFGGPIFK